MFTTKRSRRAIIGLLVVPGCLPAMGYAQQYPITADKSVKGTQPVIGVSRGVPVIQVSPPTAGGVSHNRFSHFNVGPSGAVLNNSGVASQTQLAGAIAGNPLLGTKHAKILLNEVTGASPSQLRGMLEVAGHRAHVILANPAGITCNGCGFLNTPRATLTTGRPEIGAVGAIALNIESGRIAIDGEGLNGTQAGQVDLLTRALVVNADIWADRLQVVAGPAKVELANNAVRPTDVQGKAPALALDSSALGGMYANSIRLIGTEAGVGVNVGGNIVALSGDITLNTAGNIRFAPKSTISAKEKLAITTTGKMSSAEASLSANSMTLGAKNLVNQRGDITASNALSVHVAQDIQNNNGVMAATGKHYIQAGSISNVGGTIAGANVKLVVQAGVDNRRGLLLADQGLQVNAHKLVNKNTRDTERPSAGIAADTIMLAVGTFDNTKGTTQARRTLSLSGTEVLNSSGVMGAGGNTKIQVEKLSNRQGSLLAADQLSVKTQTLEGLGWLQAGSDLLFSYPGSLSPRGSFIAGRDLKLMLGGEYVGKTRLSAGRDLIIRADSLSNASTGELLAGRIVKLNAANTAKNSGLIDAQITRISASHFHNHGRVYGDSVGITSNQLINDAGPKGSALIASRGDLKLAVGTLENRNHSVLYAKNHLSLGRIMLGTKGVSGESDSVLNHSATIEAGKSITLSSRQILNQNAHFQWDVERISSHPKVYFTPEGTTHSYDAATNWLCDRVTRACSRNPAWLNDDPERRFLLPSSTYPEARYGPPFDYAPDGNGKAGVSAPISLSYIPPTTTGLIGPERFRYSRDARIWSVFGVEPPRHDLPSRKHRQPAFIDKRRRWDDNPLPYEQLPEYVHYKERHLALDERIKAFNRDFQNRLVKHFTFYEVNEDVWQFRTVRSDPARMVSGGSMTLKGVVTNDKSQIAAAGKLSVRGPKISNVGATGWRTTFREGQATFTQARETDRKAHRAPYKVTVKSEPFDMPVGPLRTLFAPKVNLPARMDTHQMYGTLLAGQHTYITSQGNLINSGTIGASNMLHVNALNIVNHSGGYIQANHVLLNARDSLHNIAARIYGNTVSLLAGQNVNLLSTHGSETFSNTEGTFPTGESLIMAGDLQVQAGKDIQLLAAKIEAERDAKLQAGRDIKIDAATMRHKEAISSGRHQRHEMSTKKVKGSAASADRDLSLTAGNDVSMRAADVTAQRDLTINAGRDVGIEPGVDSGAASDVYREKRSGFLSSKTKQTKATVQWEQTQGSTLTGGDVDIVAGRDITIEGSVVGAKRSLDIAAEGNVDIKAGQKKMAGERTEKVTKAGLGAAGGVSVGHSQQKHTSKEKGTAKQASTVGSLEGDTQITAGDVVNIIASKVTAAIGSVDISADSINIQAGENTQDRVERFETKTSGVTIAASTPILEMGNKVAGALEGVGGAVSNPVVQGIALAVAGMEAAETISELSHIANAGKEAVIEKVARVQVTVQAGTSAASTHASTKTSSVEQASVTAGKNVKISAKGKKGKAHISVSGSTVAAKGDVTLESEGDIDLTAKHNSVSVKQKSKGASAAVGVDVSMGKGGASAGVQGSASFQHAHSNGHEKKAVNTKVSAGKTATVRSGADTALKGATVRAESVVVDVGGDLNVESVQDTATYKSKHRSASAGVVAGAGTSGSVSMSASNVEGEFASVTEQSGVQAGGGGFDVQVKGNTNLKGGAIASADEAVNANRNRMVTNTLTSSDIENVSMHNAEGFAVHGSVSVSQKKKGAGNSDASDEKRVSGAVAPGLSINKDKKTGRTRSGVSGAVVEIRDYEAQRKLTGETASQLLDKLDLGIRTGSSSGGLTRAWDPEKLRATVTAEAEVLVAFTQHATKTIDTYVTEKRTGLQKRIEAASIEEQKEIQQQINSLNVQERLLSFIVGAVSGSAPIAAVHAAVSQAADEMRQYTIADSKKFRGVTDGVTTLDNQSGNSAGIRGDRFKTAGTRVDLDIVCGKKNERCEQIVDFNGEKVLDKAGAPKIYTDAEGRVRFVHEKAEVSLDDYVTLREGAIMSGPTGGIQGHVGTLVGTPYSPTGILDFIHEAFGGPHDFIGGTLSGLYDEQGNARRDRSTFVKQVHDAWSVVALAPAAPFALAEIFPSEVWVAIDTLLRLRK